MSEQNVAGTPAADQPSHVKPNRGSRGLKAVGLVAAGVIAGGTLAATMSAMAAETPTTTPTTGTTTNGSTDGTTGRPPAGAPDGMRGPVGPQPVRSDEKALGGSDLATAKAAALKAVPGGTIVRAETDAGDATYEVHMTKSDGTVVTVKLDKSFAVTGVESGMGKGDPRMGPPNGLAPGSSSNSSSSSSSPDSSNGA